METDAFKETLDAVHNIIRDYDGNKAARIAELPHVTLNELEIQRAYRKYRENHGFLEFVTRITQEV